MFCRLLPTSHAPQSACVCATKYAASRWTSRALRRSISDAEPPLFRVPFFLFSLVDFAVPSSRAPPPGTATYAPVPRASSAPAAPSAPLRVAGAGLDPRTSPRGSAPALTSTWLAIKAYSLATREAKLSMILTIRLHRITNLITNGRGLRRRAPIHSGMQVTSLCMPSTRVTTIVQAPSLYLSVAQR